MILTIFLIWQAHAVIGAVFSVPIAFLGRKRVHWRWWELLAFLLPFGLWLGLMVSPLAPGGKSVSNLVEPLGFSLAIPVAALLRTVIGVRLPERALAGGLVGLVCLAAATSYVVVPNLPD